MNKSPCRRIPIGGMNLRLTKAAKSIANIVLMLFITLVLLVGTEFGFRLVLGKPVQASLQYSPYVFNPIYQVGLKPSAQNQFTRSEANGGKLINWATNSQGFRGPEFVSYPDYRVMVYGDSNILARFSEEKDSFVAKLQENLSQQRPDMQIEVINSGILGAGTDQLILKMQQDLPNLKPDLVVLHIFSSNDLGDLIRNRMFEVDDMGNLQRSKFAVKPDARMQAKSKFMNFVLSTRIYGVASWMNGFISGKSRSNNVDKIFANLQKSSAGEYQVYVQKKAQKYSHFDDHYDIDLATQPDSESAETKLKLLSALLGKAKAICAENNAQLMIMVQPAVFDLCQNHLFGPRDLARFGNYKQDTLCSSITKISTQKQIPTLNLYDDFLASQPEQLFFRINDDHWNDAGQALAARLAGDFISKGKLLE